MQPRFVASREDGSEGTIEAVNAEPHDANIRGAICAERAAMCLEPRLKNWRIWPLGYLHAIRNQNYIHSQTWSIKPGFPANYRILQGRDGLINRFCHFLTIM